MQTFKGTVTLDFKAVVPAAFVTEMRAQAQAEDATPFLKQVQAKHPQDDDAFVAAVLKNGIRLNVRDQLCKMLEVSGIGGTVSPAKIDVVEVPHGFNADAPIQPQVVTKESN